MGRHILFVLGGPAGTVGSETIWEQDRDLGLPWAECSEKQLMKQPTNKHFILLKLRQGVTITTKFHLEFEQFYNFN